MNQNYDEHFKLSVLESRNSKAMIARFLGWVALAALVISTGVHAVSLVINQIGVGSGIMSIIRVVSPVLVEIIASIVAIGFASHAWRGAQKLVGISVEVLWVGFAALNLLTSFSLETGEILPPVLFNWLHYGLPLSALIAGSLFYIQLRVDPEHKRQAEKQATAEMHKMCDFAAQQAVLISPQMDSVRKQQGWLQVVAGLESQGYTPQQIDFLLAGVPGLQAVAADTLVHGNKKIITQGVKSQRQQPVSPEPEEEPGVPIAEVVANKNGNGVNRPTQQGQ